MENESSRIEALLRKYRSGTISEAERAELLGHAEKHGTLKALLRDMRHSFGEATRGNAAPGSAAHHDVLDETRATRMRADIWRWVAPEKAIRRIPRWRIPAAAALVCLLGAAYFLQRNAAEPVVWLQVATAAGEQQRLVLPDSSVVYLNGNSTLSYPQAFNNAQRMVYLAGEAFFDVSRNPQQPFFVVGKDFTTKVLGTAFNVDTDLAPGIAVAEGKVQVVRIPQAIVQQTLDRSASWQARVGLRRPARVDEAWIGEGPRNEAFVTADQYVSVDTVSGILEVGQGGTPNWRAGELAFYNTPIGQIAKQLTRYYGEEIAVEETISGCEVTLPAMNKPLEQVLSTLARLRQGSVVKIQETWHLRGRGC